MQNVEDFIPKEEFTPLNIGADEFIPVFSPNMDTDAKDFQPGLEDLEEQKKNNEKFQKKTKGLFNNQNLNIKQNVITDGEMNAHGTLIQVKERLTCSCCQGDVNNCSGEECQHLGICFCMVVDEEDLADFLKE